MHTTHITRADALNLLKKYNQEPFHLLHALTVEAVMRRLAVQLGYADEADFWALCGLLHDIDFEKFPQAHCQKAPELLAEIQAEPELVHAVCSHSYGITVDIRPEHEMEKVLFAVDELTGLIGAAACSRDIIKKGAELLGWELDKLLDTTLCAMRETETAVHTQAEEITK